MVESPKGCPDPEVLAAYVDRGLSLAELARLNRHLASCPQCVSLVAGVVRTVAEVSGSKLDAGTAVEAASRATTRRTLVGVLAAAAAVLAVLFSPSLLRPWPEREAGLVSLDGVAGFRSVLGRLTGGFPHAPLGAPSAGGQGGRAAETDRVLLTAARIRESFGERDTPSHLHELGLSQLMAGRYDDAALALLAASREQPANARYLNDVAAVQLERARLGLRPDDLPRAFASANRARRLDPTLREAWFNRALAATALSLTTQARSAWADYLERDATSPWADEARSRLAELSQPTAASAWASLEPRLNGSIGTALADEAVRTQMSEARAYLETNLLPKWAASVEAGHDGSAELEKVRTMADAFARVAGDVLYKDLVIAIDRAAVAGATARLGLAVAHRQYAEAALVFAADRLQEAEAGFRAAGPGLTALGSPFGLRATIELAAVTYVLGRSDQALPWLTAAVTTARSRNYLYAAGRGTWFLGLVAFGQGRIGDAQAHYEDTLATFERMGDAEQEAGAHNLLASLHGYLGDEGAAWTHRGAALPALSVTRSQRLQYGLLAGAAAAVRRHDPEAALAFQDAVVEQARLSGREAAIVDALSTRASLLAELGRSGEASQVLAEARTRVDRLPNLALRERAEEPVLAAESDVFRNIAPARAVAAATLAIARVGQRRERLRLAQLSLKLAEANLALGRLDAAEAAIASGIQAFDEERASLTDEGRVSTLDDSWQLFDTAVHLALRKKDYPLAFAMAERARARTLAERNLAGASRSLADVEQALQPGEAVVALNQFEDELAVWVIKKTGTTVVMRPVSRVDGQRLVARQQVEIHNGAAPDASTALFNQILRPVASQLAGVSRLAVVPDARYADASFAAFWDPSKQRFLVELMIVTTAPRVTLAAAGRSAPGRPSDLTRPLIVAGAGDAAITAARDVAAAYGDPTVVSGSAATRSLFIANAPSRSIVHLAAPTRANAAYPLLAGVSLAAEPGQRHTGNLLGRDIVARSMARTRLVSINDVRGGGLAQNEGSRDLARAFLAAGVPAVLGTLPGANEAATRELMVAFHRLMSSGITADEALNTLQRNVIKSNGRRLGAWSVLVLYGSDR